MSPGWKTSEFWLAAKWSAMGAASVAGLLSFHPGDWMLALAVSPAVCLLVYLAGLSAHNYGENRFRLKAHLQTQATRAEPEQATEPARAIGFRCDPEKHKEDVNDGK